MIEINYKSLNICAAWSMLLLNIELSIALKADCVICIIALFPEVKLLPLCAFEIKAKPKILYFLL